MPPFLFNGLMTLFLQTMFNVNMSLDTQIIG